MRALASMVNNAWGGMSNSEQNTSALAFLQQLAKEVSEGNVDLPGFPDVVVRISLALADPNTNADRIVTIVGAEPRLAARILQTANSAAFKVWPVREALRRTKISKAERFLTSMTVRMSRLTNVAK